MIKKLKHKTTKTTTKPCYVLMNLWQSCSFTCSMHLFKRWFWYLPTFALMIWGPWKRCGVPKNYTVFWNLESHQSIHLLRQASATFRTKKINNLSIIMHNACCDQKGRVKAWIIYDSHLSFFPIPVSLSVGKREAAFIFFTRQTHKKTRTLTLLTYNLLLCPLGQTTRW